MSTKRGEGAAKLDEMIAQFDQFYADAQRADSKGTKLGSGYFWEWAKRGRELKAALEASSPSALIAAVVRLEREIFDCEQLEKDYSNRSQKELDDEWITADEIKHRIGGLKFALELLRAAPTEEVA